MIDPPEWGHAYLVPEWQKDVNEYILQLELAKEMMVFQTDQTLIYHSLVKSNKTDVLVNLTKIERGSLEEFVKYLRTNYGPTTAQLRRQFEEIEQKDNESMHQYFKRVELAYFRSKNLAIPATIPDYQQEDIKWKFLSGMKNRETFRLMKLNPTHINYNDLASTAAELDASLKDLERQ